MPLIQNLKVQFSFNPFYSGQRCKRKSILRPTRRQSKSFNPFYSGQRCKRFDITTEYAQQEMFQSIL